MPSLIIRSMPYCKASTSIVARAFRSPASAVENDGIMAMTPWTSFAVTISYLHWITSGISTDLPPASGWGQPVKQITSCQTADTTSTVIVRATNQRPVTLEQLPLDHYLGGR